MTKKEMKDEVENRHRLIVENLIAQQLIQMNITLEKLKSNVRIKIITLDE